MEIHSRFTRKSLFDRTFCLSKLIFTYIFPIFYQGFKNNGLDFQDLYRCPKDDEAEKSLNQLKRSWTKELIKEKPKLWRALLKAFGPSFIIPLFCYIFEECFIRIVQPFLLGRVIRYFSNDETITYEDACWSAAGVTICTAFFISCHHPAMIQAMRIGMRMRTACCSLMFQKALRLSRASVNQTAVGQIVNIMSNDVNRMDEFSIFVSYMIVSPIQMLIVIYILFDYIKWTCFVGLALLFLLIPIQVYMGRLFSRVRSNTARQTDQRLRLMNEITSGIRVIKMYSWEKPFANRIADARKTEVKYIRQACYLKAINLSMFFVATRIVLFVCFITYVLVGNQLTSEAVFVSMALFNTLRLTITFFFPNSIGLASELLIGCKRIENFLLLKEMECIPNQQQQEKFKKENFQQKHCSENDKDKKSKNNLEDNLMTPPTPAPSPLINEPKLIINNIVAKWSQELMQPTLRNISVRLKSGDLLAVIGPVGSGKSSFLMSILHELPIESGKIDIEGSISYASQDPWSFNESVRNNILFGMPFDQKHYDQVIKVCALERDLTLMPFGDRTLVGEKGVSLSGGQKARINLARAIYRNPDICLLDDPLSAVDTSVAEHIFENCIIEHLKSKIRILVTHQIQFIQKATKILILKEGDCLAFGTFAELQQMGIDFMSLLNEKSITNDNDGSDQSGGGGGQGGEHQKLTSSNSFDGSETFSTDCAIRGRSRTISSGFEGFEVLPSDDNAVATAANENQIENNDETKSDTKLTEEQYQRGSIKWKVYREYLKAGSGIISLTITIIFLVLSQTIFNGSDIFLTAWTNKNQFGENQISDQEQHQDIIIYSILIGTLFITTIVRSVSFFQICMRASERLHNQIFERLLQAKVAFFDQNPAGRILNRFTKDLGIIDEMLPSTAYDLNLTFSQAIGIIVTVSIVNWWLILPAIFLTIIIFFMRGIYIKSARDIKRFEGLARSPVYSHISTTINGLASIRAFGAQKAFERQFFIYQNDHSATWFLFISSSRCMGLIIDWIATIYIAVISFVIMMSKDMQGGSAGLAISSGLMLAGMTQWAVRQSAEFESQMTSVERIVEYQDLPKEPLAESEPGKRPSNEWPTEGTIEFDHMYLRYSGSDKPVLKNINCTILGGEKIGIVGRTGAGKSSLIAALFRLTEIDGSIRIDNIDTKSIGLKDLRKKLSIIPQDPVVFSGSVRYNLDPFNEYDDDNIWKALEEVQLKTQVNNYKGKLSGQITESGSNLSVGQRQLICLARAILKNNRILILDEATANVDHQTDKLIQETIREKFSDCTVLTIAHRLNTIIDCDRVLVLDAGEIVEFDIPYLLLRNKGIFYEMCKKTGRSMFANLYQLAKITHKNKLRLNLMENMDKTIVEPILDEEDLAVVDDEELLLNSDSNKQNDNDNNRFD
ncbi:Multidrug resistance-associated protein 4 [Dermatophagoides pteronyssinus]|uniref:Multidrug resistance-associated protein 4 n=1 Tax=Dermatophagoides pteronyssinus TaxID=6956 RepID=A0ABQ8JER7_DERPT|nr:Multidrug resistance-associated protein 4 [Dermatophagoides pteronyssinus]